MCRWECMFELNIHLSPQAIENLHLKEFSKLLSSTSAFYRDKKSEKNTYGTIV